MTSFIFERKRHKVSFAADVNFFELNFPFRQITILKLRNRTLLYYLPIVGENYRIPGFGQPFSSTMRKKYNIYIYIYLECYLCRICLECWYYATYILNANIMPQISVMLFMQQMSGMLILCSICQSYGHGGGNIENRTPRL